ncbi:hypothetical protein [Rossellomorea vietnamensis]|uniref:hypothetical protein n=1 Tax=Rossellomorea vietnamensis TaxID=218284 RepID=UPI001E31B965|nr:hypothetical protein [Rossellomorea vietnamensis]MCC5803190.1 hypothetical protein [Rossellomorea vietnamensis]
MIDNTLKLKKAIRFALLFFAIFTGISGTISLSIVTLLLSRDGQLQSQYPAIIILAILIYLGSGLSLLIRSKFFKKEGISDE